MAARKRKSGGVEPVKGGQKRSNNATSYNRKDVSYSSTAKEKNNQKTPTQSVSSDWLKKNRSTPSKGTYGTRAGVNKLK